MDTAMIKPITDIAANVLWLGFLWEMVKAAKTIANPDTAGIGRILFSLRRNRILLQEIISELGQLGKLPGSAEPEEFEPTPDAPVGCVKNFDPTALQPTSYAVFFSSTFMLKQVTSCCL
jgi:hypothetical protein